MTTVVSRAEWSQYGNIATHSSGHFQIERTRREGYTWYELYSRQRYLRYPKDPTSVCWTNWKFEYESSCADDTAAHIPEVERRWAAERDPDAFSERVAIVRFEAGLSEEVAQYVAQTGCMPQDKQGSL
jgi:hypothetical protein